MHPHGKVDVKLSIQVKGYDIDVAGIVHNSVYTCWLDDVRTAFLARVEPIEVAVKNGYIPALSRTDISYKRPIRFGDQVVAHLWLTAIGKIKWGVYCEFRVNDTVCAAAHQHGCFIDMNSLRPVSIPSVFHTYWQNSRADDCSPESFKGTDSGASCDEFLSEPIVCPV